jgi:hypothetical protein
VTLLAVYIILGFLGASALVTFGWCLRAGVERNNRGQVDLSRAAARGELDRRYTDTERG